MGWMAGFVSCASSIGVRTHGGFLSRVPRRTRHDPRPRRIWTWPKRLELPLRSGRPRSMCRAIATVRHTLVPILESHPFARPVRGYGILAGGRDGAGISAGIGAAVQGCGRRVRRVCIETAANRLSRCRLRRPGRLIGVGQLRTSAGGMRQVPANADDYSVQEACCISRVRGGR